MRGSLVLLRHGESTANADGLFTGVLDVPLTTRGVREAGQAAQLLIDADIHPNVVFSSTLRRATTTADIVVARLAESATQLPDGRYVTDWRVNERNYGALTGQSKQAVLAEHGEQQFLSWRRSVDTSPPPMDDELFDSFATSEQFRFLPNEALQRTESLRDVIARVSRFYVERVAPVLAADGCVLVIGHGNSLRALCGALENLDDEQLKTLNIPTGHPLLYTLGTDTVLGRFAPGRYLDPHGALHAAVALALDGGT